MSGDSCEIKCIDNTALIIVMLPDVSKGMNSATIYREEYDMMHSSGGMRLLRSVYCAFLTFDNKLQIVEESSRVCVLCFRVQS